MGHEPYDPLAFVDEFTPIREALLGLVAMFRADGFTEEQARQLAVASWLHGLKQTEQGEP